MWLPDGTERLRFYWDRRSTPRQWICGQSGAFWENLSTASRSSPATPPLIKSRRSWSWLGGRVKRTSSRSSRLWLPISSPALTFPRKKPLPPCSPQHPRMRWICWSTCWSSIQTWGTLRKMPWTTDMWRTFTTRLKKSSAMSPSVKLSLCRNLDGR